MPLRDQFLSRTEKTERERRIQFLLMYFSKCEYEQRHTAMLEQCETGNSQGHL